MLRRLKPPKTTEFDYASRAQANMSWHSGIMAIDVAVSGLLVRRIAKHRGNFFYALVEFPDR